MASMSTTLSRTAVTPAPSSASAGTRSYPVRVRPTFVRLGRLSAAATA